jgi:hypothetical protein
MQVAFSDVRVTIAVVGLPSGQHKVLIELAEVTRHTGLALI